MRSHRKALACRQRRQQRRVSHHEGSVTPAGSSHSKVPSNEFVPSQAFQPAQQFNEFVPGQSFLPQPQIAQQPNVPTPINAFADPFLNQQTIQHTIAGLDGSQAQFSAFQPSVPTLPNQSYYQDTTGFKHPLNYHLSAAVGPRRDNMQPYERASADFFIPDDLREELHKKADAALQTFANSTLPQQVEHFHSLVALDTNNQKGQSFFGYPSWVYKATSMKDGHIYALRRIAGFRLTNEQAITSFNAWKRVNSASIVKVHDAFTGKMFGDSSLVVVTDYHPLSQNLAEKHFPQGRTNRSGNHVVPENDLWGYIVQLGNALKAIHEAGLAAKTVTASKILVTSKNRLRLNGCGVLDILQYEQRPQTTELQRMDLQDLGRLILSIAVRNPSVGQNTEKALQLAHRAYSERFIACLQWLLSPPVTSRDDLSPAHQSNQPSSLDEYNVTTLLNNIADKVISTLDSALHCEDELTNYLSRELENGRLFRLLTKINVILERPESVATSSSSTTTNPSLLNQPSSAWSETGERYYLKLFRDYVFHQVDHNGRPVLDLGHIITCLNKLDAGVDENIQLVSRDEQDMLIASYKEIKRGFESAWAELSKASTPSRR
ncbi:hypothetical protein M433DRAFT_511509 [Acidomyces richmondensis BFW]|nr:MAG: hypothetical protein FE78DRAFT_390634 [Acidomyces sp. 'richmondensis']KYG47193.1 hypothetical protein M433DRAFT_511509 [Acidomyces richmondensis BFW]